MAQKIKIPPILSGIQAMPWASFGGVSKGHYYVQKLNRNTPKLKMKGADSSEGSKSSYSNKKDEDRETSNSKPKYGESTSNSSVEETEKKATSGPARQYNRSTLPRLRWTPELHLCFVHAVERLGGQDRATSEFVLQLMNIKGLSIAHVKSHLQSFSADQTLRCQLCDRPGHSARVLERRHRHIIETAKTFMHQASIYGDASWRGHENQIYNSYMGGATKRGIYGSVYERFEGCKNHTDYNSIFQDPFKLKWFCRPSSVDDNFKTKFQARGIEQVLDCLDDASSSYKNWKTAQEKQALKRRNSDPECDLNLNLGIKVGAKDVELERRDDVDIRSSISSSKLKRFNEEDANRKRARIVAVDKGIDTIFDLQLYV
ncbi:hypothetical protein K2173_002970 [Erythroxylum novogranatense]|uniref:HTH myb-type domain-containing protein n=1 Tax=Erythroxylum novogranatense TaxID=1862640 RepID=A0AAV8TRA1_9ROSI|nr:hypothetical protein K2173_002970 [Erythroxylum novogranatense]